MKSYKRDSLLSVRSLILLIGLFTGNLGHGQQLTRTISGKVTDHVTGEALADAKVSIQEHKVKTSIDTLGRYILIVPDSINTKKVVVEVSSAGYDTNYKHVNTKKLPRILNFKMKLQLRHKLWQFI